MGNSIFFIALGALLFSAVSSWELTGSDVTVLTGGTASLKCDIKASENTTEDPIFVWRDHNGDLMFFGDEKVQAGKRMSVNNNDDEMILTIDDVALEDEQFYECGLNRIDPTVYNPMNLIVNQNPKVFGVSDNNEEPIDGAVASVATCYAKGAKPEPRLWFTDSSGNVVEVLENLLKTEHSNKVVDVSLELKAVFTKENHNSVYKCHVEKADGSVESRETARVQVRHAATARLTDVKNGEHPLLEEGQRMEVTCAADGYPEPIVEWSFTPDVETNHTKESENYWPANFARLDGGWTISSDSIAVTDDSLTNNGTFKCKVTNGIGDPVLLSFRLGVYALPVTTVPTTPALPKTSKPSESTAIAEPRSAGSDAAVIGGVVAVAAFVLIVAIILIARYFMSHKGTYHTHEIKSHDVDEERMGDDHPMVDDDDDLGDLGQKKRTEYFM